MNVYDFWDDALLIVQAKRGETALEMLIRRRNSFNGFCEVENGQGGIDPKESLVTPAGQNYVRQLFARTMEELLESFDSRDEVHRREELVDALNFGSSMVFLNDSRMVAVGKYAAELEKRLNTAEYGVDWDAKKLFLEVGLAFDPTLQLLRNRSWQSSTQHQYFLGENTLRESVLDLWVIIARQFESRAAFEHMFFAKDLVLQFRLRTNY